MILTRIPLKYLKIKIVFSIVSGGRSLLKATDRGCSTELFLILLRAVLPGIDLNITLERKPYNLSPYALLYIYSNIIL